MVTSMATKKQGLSQQFNWLLFRARGAKLELRKVQITNNMRYALEDYEKARLKLISTLERDVVRETFYSMNGVKNGD